jgi:hypothetical protein
MFPSSSDSSYMSSCLFMLEFCNPLLIMSSECIESIFKAFDITCKLKL